MSTNRFSEPLEPLDQGWCAEVRAQLEREANALDAVTLARLSAARHRALAAAGKRAPGHSSGRWLPWFCGAVAASLLLAVMLDRGWSEHSVTAATAPPSPTASEAQPTLPPASLVAGDVDVAVIADLEFYDWLEEQDAVL